MSFFHLWQFTDGKSSSEDLLRQWDDLTIANHEFIGDSYDLQCDKYGEEIILLSDKSNLIKIHNLIDISREIVLVCNAFYFSALYLFKRSTVTSNSGRLKLSFENLTYSIQIPSDVIKFGKYRLMIIRKWIGGLHVSWQGRNATMVMWVWGIMTRLVKPAAKH